MNKFEIREEFYVNNEKIKIISGACHYFRIVPEYWRDRLEKLVFLGCNCVETYIPWNVHEAEQGIFDFSKGNDIAKFVKIAQELGLYVILRPSPFICAEWEFGGLPYWLLKDDSMIVRSTYNGFLEAVDKYYDELFKVISPLQITNGGPVIMMQVENEYGSYGNDKKYLKAIKDLMIKHGCNVPLFTSDGAWDSMLEAGTLCDEGVIPTGNFGSSSKDQLKNLEIFMNKKKIKAPLMCMEFWIGWFSSWGKELKVRDYKDAANELKEILDLGSVNIYMYHGGTNWGFYNGANYYDEVEPQITSYDYDALLTEWGEKTEKYNAFREVISEYKNIEDNTNSTNIKFINYGKIKLSNKVSLFNTIDRIAKPVYNDLPLNMEKLNQGYGYILYRTNIEKDMTSANTARIVDCNDRAIVYCNEEHIITQSREKIGKIFDLKFDTAKDNRLDILVENEGRINYGYNLRSSMQKKGIKGGVQLDIHFHHGWDHYCLDFKDISNIDFNGGYKENTPAFYEFTFNVEEKGDTFIELDKFGKGCAFINGFNLGRFYDAGPTLYLYIPAPLLRSGENKIVIFETEGRYSDYITLSNKPLLK
ncbi:MULTISPECIES: beta-galactosidase family protein [unclassified Clostridium]|uniref:glycoside hydrolase family 35 protein n=1 Tax=Clostridium TaxID=1485 RepID=UPI001C8C8580|nr:MULTISPECIES: beta-galactosidase family protein [unclassified Clostridium]MBX9136575.1 beta-galactosidase [Clostridium sp. K12(2020)]MBX9142944.1 beta-galactosidase [Clostridium sp. K13]MDU2289897.1 beta-galactosidase [Clostridium celatum]MDU4325839.1 beta-galactosidase [Clostridium celatum]